MVLKFIVHLLCCSDGLSMTIITPIEDTIVGVNGTNVSSMLHKHWGSTHSVQVYREPNKSLGISIVGGKVSLVFNKTSLPVRILQINVSLDLEFLVNLGFALLIGFVCISFNTTFCSQKSAFNKKLLLMNSYY